jgi:predicted nucleotidyltransferase
VPKTAAADFLSILRTLREHGVEFVVVGGVGAVLQGAPINTFDLDIVHSTEEDNLGRLLAALESLDAYYRTQPERRLKPDKSHLASPGHQLLMTRHGPLDLLGAIGNSHTYRELEPDSMEMKIGGAITVHVLNLEQLIAIKEETAGPKDLVVLPILKRTLEEKLKTSQH